MYDRNHTTMQQPLKYTTMGIPILPVPNKHATVTPDPRPPGPDPTPHPDLELVHKADTKARERVIYEARIKHWRRVEKKGGLAALSLDPATIKQLEAMELQDMELDLKHDPSLVLGFWVTISPDPTVWSYEMLYEWALKYFQAKAGYSEYIWCIESYSSVTHAHTHPHIHAVMLLKKGTPAGEPARARRKLQQVTHKKFVTKTPNSVLIREIASERVIADKVSYVKGQKYDPVKETQVQADKEWRQRAGLQDYYTWAESVASPPRSGCPPQGLHTSMA